MSRFALLLFLMPIFAIASQESLLAKARNAKNAGSITASIYLYKDYLINDKNDIDVILELASTYIANKETNKAKQTYIHAFNISNNNKIQYKICIQLMNINSEYSYELLNTNTKDNVALIAAKLAHKLSDEHAMLQAEKYMQIALSREPDNVTYLYNISSILESLEKYNELITIYSKISDLTKTDRKFKALHRFAQQRSQELKKYINSRDK